MASTAIQKTTLAAVLAQHFSEAQREKLDLIQQGIDELVGEIDCMEVRAPEDAANLNNLLGSVKRTLADIEYSRTNQVKPLNETVKQINDVWRRPKEILEEAEKAAKRKLVSFLQAERERVARAEREAQETQAEIARRQAEALAKAETAKGQERAEALREADNAGTALAVAQAVAPAPAPRGIKSDGGADGYGRVTSSLREVWTFRLVDKMKVPHQFLAVDEHAVRAAIASGIRGIEGLEIYAEETLATR